MEIKTWTNEDGTREAQASDDAGCYRIAVHPGDGGIIFQSPVRIPPPILAALKQSVSK
jgi:hypothetical protein